MKRLPTNPPRLPRTLYLTNATWAAIEALGKPKGYSRSDLIEEMFVNEKSGV